MRYPRRTLLTATAGSVALAATITTASPPSLAQQPASSSTGAPFPGVPATPLPQTTFTARSSDGTTLVGDAQGDPAAPELLLVHGLRQSRLSWERQNNDPALAGLRIVRFDLRGHGDSDKPAAPGAYAQADLWADDVAAVIAAAALRRPVLVGWSLGGYVAGAYLRRYGGGKLAGVNLVDAVTRFGGNLLTPLAAAFSRSCTAEDLLVRSTATAEFLRACFHQMPATPELEQMLIVNGMTPAAVNRGFNTTDVTDLEPALRDFAGPVLLSHGRHDRLVALAMSESVRSVRGKGQISIYENSGHSPFYEEPERFNRELLAFVDEAAKR